MSAIPDDFRDLLERPIIASLATVMPNGQPQVHPIWADMVDGQVRINTVAGRQKHRNLVERRHATLLIVDPDNPMRWMEIRGELAETCEKSGIEVIDKLSRDYLNQYPYPWHKEADTRVTCLIRPLRVMTNDG